MRILPISDSVHKWKMEESRFIPFIHLYCPQVACVIIGKVIRLALSSNPAMSLLHQLRPQNAISPLVSWDRGLTPVLQMCAQNWESEKKKKKRYLVFRFANEHYEIKAL